MDVAFPEMSEDDNCTISAFLFTEVDGMIYTDIITCLRNVLSHASEYESYSGNIYYLQMNAQTTTIFDMYANTPDDDDEDEDNEDDEDEDERELLPEMTIATRDLLDIMLEYREKKSAFAKGWRPDIIIEDDPESITNAQVVAKYIEITMNRKIQ